MVTLAAGAGSRWTQGAGVVKALHPFCKLGGRHRTFLEVHLAKSRRSGAPGRHAPAARLHHQLPHPRPDRRLPRSASGNYGYPGPLLLSPGRSVGLRLVPMARDLRFAWEEMPQQVLDEQAQKVRDSLHAALIGWARQAGEGSDYTDNVPLQCLHPVGHWFEVPNLLRNGVLAGLLRRAPAAAVPAAPQHRHRSAPTSTRRCSGCTSRRARALTFEVITPAHRRPRRRAWPAWTASCAWSKGLAMPREEDEFGLSYYNSLHHLGRHRPAPGRLRPDPRRPGRRRTTGAPRRRRAPVAARMPTYITLKDVKKRWGHGQEDVFPVAQFEKLWGDMTALPEVDARFVVVPRVRGQQLKDQAQLDGWLRDGSAADVERLCDWE